MDVKAGDAIELTGRARVWDGELVCCRVTFANVTRTVEAAPPFELEIAGSERRVLVYPPKPLEGHCGPLVKATGKWSELDIPLRDRFQAIAPAPDQKTVVESVRIPDGTEVHVHGRVRAVVLDRGTPSVESMHAELIGVGPNAIAALAQPVAEPDAPVKKRPIRLYAMLAVRALALLPLVVMIVRASAGWSTEQATFAWGAAIGAYGVGATISHLLTRVRVVTIGKDDERSFRGLGTLYTFAFLLPTMLMVMAIAPLAGGRATMKSAPKTHVDEIGMCIMIACFLALALVLSWLARGKLRRVARLVRDSSDDWTIVQGHATTGFAPGAQLGFKSTVATAGEIMIELRNALVAAPRFDFSTRPQIEPGVPVTVAGRTTQLGGVPQSASVPGSLVVVAAPQRVLARGLVKDTVVVVELAAAIVACIVVAVVV